MPESRIVLGVIGRPHGVRGLVRVVSHATDPASLAAYGLLTDRQGRRFTLRWRGEGIAEISEIRDGVAVPISDRNAAERLTNTELGVTRDRLPPPEADEFYLADLIGLAAFDPAGERLGSVTAVHDYGAGTSLEIVPEGGGQALLVPFTRAAVPDINVAAGRLTVAMPDEIEVRDDDMKAEATATDADAKAEAGR